VLRLFDVGLAGILEVWAAQTVNVGEVTTPPCSDDWINAFLPRLLLLRMHRLQLRVFPGLYGYATYARNFNLDSRRVHHHIFGERRRFCIDPAPVLNSLNPQRRPPLMQCLTLGLLSTRLQVQVLYGLTSTSRSNARFQAGFLFSGYDLGR